MNEPTQMTHSSPHHPEDVYWMRVALAQAQAAAQAGEVPVGAVVVREGQWIASGGNAPIANHDPTAHAEIVALRAAAQQLGNYRLENCTLYVTLEPCAMCSGALLHARLGAVVYGASDPKTGAAGSALQVLQHPALNHHTEVRSGVLADECAAVLRQFFAPKRRNPQPLREDALRPPEHCFAGLQLADLPQTSAVPAAVSKYWHWVDAPGSQGWRLHGVDAPPMPRPQQAVWTLLCLHPSMAWSWSFRQLWPVGQAAGWRVIAPDLLGFGRSDKPKKAHVHTPQWHAKMLVAWLDHLEIATLTLLYYEHFPLDFITLELASILKNRLQKIVTLHLPAGVAKTRSRRAVQLAPWCDAPFPDAGHRAGPKAWAAWTHSPTALDAMRPPQPPRQRLPISGALWAELMGTAVDEMTSAVLPPTVLTDWPSVIAQVQQSTLSHLQR